MHKYENDYTAMVSGFLCATTISILAQAHAWALNVPH